MTWNYRLIVVVPDASRSLAEQAARAINSTGPDYTGWALDRPLSSSGQEPPTHWGLYTSATDEMVAMMASALPQVAGAMFWRHDVDHRLVASNVTEAGGQPWGWLESLEAAGLAAIEKPFG